MRFADVGRILTLHELIALKQNGVDGINPYIDPSGNPKDCTDQYLDDIYAAGLLLGGFFIEDTGGSGDGDPYFTEARGKTHAEYVNARVEHFVSTNRVPKGVRCWYTCDTRLQEVTHFDDYANGVERNATDVQSPGEYGFEWLVRYVQARQANGDMRYPKMGSRAFLTYGYSRDLQLDGWQNEQVTIEGITVDLSDMYIEGWRPKKMTTPVYCGESASTITVVVGQAQVVQTMWDYGNGPRAVAFKVYASKPGMWPVLHYPPVDPDADPTLDLAAQPGLFIVAAVQP